jgi:AAA+ ATPase superfamily predicted ATPase
MEFVGRSEEMRRLNDLCRRRPGGLAVLTGRRRVGKTRLLVEWGRRHAGLYTVADQSAAEIQRRYFCETLAGRFPVFQDATFRDWRSMLKALAEQAKVARWKGPLILDEFPFLVASSPELPSVVQHFVDHEAVPAGLVVAIAGSGQRMMHGLVLDASAPLYGRAVEMMVVKPLRVADYTAATGIADPIICVKAYTAWGGIPRYWELAEPHATRIDEAVDQCVLDPLSPLHGEPDRLLLDEVPSALGLRPILDAVGLGAHRPSEIAARIGQPPTSLARPLARLTEMGLVRREVPFGESEKSAKRALYRIADPFMRMWFRTVAPHRALLTQAPAAVRRKLWESARPGLCAAAWEELCRRSVALTTDARGPLGRLGPWLPAGQYWQGKGPEWDVVSCSLDGKRGLIGEVKWSERPTSGAELHRVAGELRRKGVPPALSKASEIVHCIFVPRTEDEVREIEGMLIVDAAAVVATGI